MTWKSYWKKIFWSALSLNLCLFLFILLLDPYDNVPFSPKIERAPIANNQRFSYPAIAKNKEYNSIVVGTSTSRMLEPALLNKAFGLKFANLSMNSATSFEQYKILKLFVDHHKDIKMVLIGIDVVWCYGKQTEKYTFRPFPPWMYDDNVWNDLLYLYNDYALENSVRLIEYLTGNREPRYGIDGYSNFLPPSDEYQLEKARKNIYGSLSEREREESLIVPEDAEKQKSIHFPSHNLLDEILSFIGGKPKKLLFFVPYHQKQTNGNYYKYKQCKTDLIKLAKKHNNTELVDFMIPSPITLNDHNYWDPLHYTKDIADIIPDMLSTAIRTKAKSAFYNYLPGEQQ